MTNVKLIYFKDTGKYYSEGSYVSYGGDSWIFPAEVMVKNDLGTLPDLSNGKWDGFVLITHDGENAVPHLVDLR